MSALDEELEFFFDKPWSDGLPVVIPTEERIERMLTGTDRDPDEVIGLVPPVLEEASVRSVAMHAVMAGCKPEYLPVVLAGLEAMLDERMNLGAFQATMRSAAPLMIVNGPYAKEIGLHGGAGCFGPGFRANATIGRAIRLILYNLGGGVPGVASMTCFGQPARYSYCVAENEEESPWEPLSVSRGFSENENLVTVVGCEGPVVVWDDVSRDPERLFVAIGETMASMGSTTIFIEADLVVVFSLQYAKLCADAGLSKKDVHSCLCETAGRRLGDLKRGGLWRGEEGLARWNIEVDINDDDFFVPAISRPEDLHLLVAGGWPGPCSLVMHGVNASSRAVSRPYSI